MTAAHWTSPIMGLQIDVPKDALTAFCEERGIRRPVILRPLHNRHFGEVGDP